ncbi:uncharacterized protein LOC123209191 isoform X2 [Mangifera indica]|uniref:uncharacterized protein LOC123209191 isoform X2 n=1 Tax=Mangifera indica TaxID=29780 RepID=UPI001CFA2F87|nr:uncharacterized protein LOC123209191 isoform X2 [Mangifera indica]
MIKMCDSPVVRSAFSLNSSISRFSGSEAGYYKSDSQLDVLDELDRDNSSLEVQRLQQKLHEEMELHIILENAIKKNAVKPSSSSCLPHHAWELLSNIAVLEISVSKLEQEIVSLHFQLSQERNERRLTEYHLRRSSSLPLTNCSTKNIESLHLNPEVGHLPEGSSCQDQGDQPSESNGELCCSESIMEDADDSDVYFHEKKMSTKTNSKPSQFVEFRRLPTGITPKGLWDNPNKLSEEMVRCMKNIFMSLADSAIPSKSCTPESHFCHVSPRGHLSSSSWWSSSERSMISSWVQSPQIDVQNNAGILASENTCDPYKVRGKLSWVDVGNYGLATEVSWMSVGKKQLEYASGALKKFRTLVEQLAKVNPIHLSSNEKLAFWINLYNALIMHAYLAYRVPRSDLKLFSLMQKAAYTVGGHSYSAAAIEYVILKMKPPLHRPQIALLLAIHKLKVSEEQKKSAIDLYEPLVAFALSCGMYSSPAVRIYTAKNLREELQEAQHDFIRASVGVSSKGKLLVPKMLHCFAKGLVDDVNLAVWISHYLPPIQAAFVEQCISQRRESLLGSRNCGILPFDSHFRYLFLPDKFNFDNASSY